MGSRSFSGTTTCRRSVQLALEKFQQPTALSVESPQSVSPSSEVSPPSVSPWAQRIPRPPYRRDAIGADLSPERSAAAAVAGAEYSFRDSQTSPTRRAAAPGGGPRMITRRRTSPRSTAREASPSGSGAKAVAFFLGEPAATGPTVMRRAKTLPLRGEAGAGGLLCAEVPSPPAYPKPAQPSPRTQRILQSLSDFRGQPYSPPAAAASRSTSTAGGAAAGGGDVGGNGKDAARPNAAVSAGRGEHCCMGYKTAHASTDCPRSEYSCPRSNLCREAHAQQQRLRITAQEMRYREQQQQSQSQSQSQAQAQQVYLQLQGPPGRSIAMITTRAGGVAPSSDGHDHYGLDPGRHQQYYSRPVAAAAGAPRCGRHEAHSAGRAPPYNDSASNANPLGDDAARVQCHAVSPRFYTPIRPLSLAGDSRGRAHVEGASPVSPVSLVAQRLEVWFEEATSAGSWPHSRHSSSRASVASAGS
ncbi:unnamed protein product [Closterium sp. Naga37s-1]|nr:unnamed protein product [Closterium sp. Naga37s-1]